VELTTFALCSGVQQRIGQSKALKPLHGDDSATSCKTLVNFGRVTSEITIVECEIFAATWPKTGIKDIRYYDSHVLNVCDFSPYESASRADDRPGPLFPIPLWAKFAK